jgi:hypothetical protein
MVERRLKATLPGTIFKRGRRWWWRVQLPGEPKSKARSLIPEGERYGVTNVKNAGAVALALWQRALERQTRKRAGEEARIRAIRRAALWARRVRDARRETEQAQARRRTALERVIEAYRQQAEAWALKLQQAKAEGEKALAQQQARQERIIRGYRRRARAWALRVQEARAEGAKALARRQAAYQKARAAHRRQAQLGARRLEQARAETDQAVVAQRNECARRMRAYRAWAAQARERAIARIRTDANRTIAAQKSEFTRQIRACKRKIAKLWNRETEPTRTEVKKAQDSKKNGFRRRSGNHTKALGKLRRRKSAGAERKSRVQATMESTTVPQAASEYAAAQTQIRRQSEAELNKIITSIQRIAYCECCFGNGIPEAALNRIDSGQRLCPSCMKALKEKEAEMARLEQLPA